MNKYSFKILLTLFILFGLNLKGQNDSLSFFIKHDLLGISNLKEKNDTSGIKVISASRSAKNIEDLPITIYVITHEEIQRNHYTSLADILKYLPGIRVSQPGSGEIGEIFQFRGLIGNYYTKILVNNLPIKPTVVNGMPLASQLPIRQAERIEIIYGPAAAIYGADAVTGVINIITKDSEKGTFVRGDIYLGRNYDYINFMVGGKAGKNKNIMQYSFYGSKSEFNSMNIKNTRDNTFNPLYYLDKKVQTITLNGNDYKPSEITDEILTLNSISSEDFINQYFEQQYEGELTFPAMEDLTSASNQIGFEIKYRGFNISYYNMFRKAHSSIGRSGYLYKYNDPQNYWGEKIQRTVISYDRKWEKFASGSHLSYLSYRMDNNSSYGLTSLSNTDKAYIYSASDDIFAEQLLTYTPIPKLEIVSGISYQYSGNLPVTSYQSSPFNAHQYEAFMTSSIEPDPFFGNFGLNPVAFQNLSSFLQFFYVRRKLTFMGGLRYDMNSQYGNNLNPRLAILYKTGKRTTISASYGSAYMAPTSSMSYQSFAYRGGANNDSIYYQAIPNKDLEPEIFKAYELAVKRRFFKNVYVDLSFFYNEIENLIVDTYIPLNALDLPLAITETDSSRVRIKNNSSEAMSTLYGLQANFKFKDILKSIKLNAELSLTFTQKSETLPELGSILGSFELMPNHMGQFRVSFQPTNRLFVQFDNVWMSKWLRVLIPFEELYSDPYDEVDGYYTLDALINFNVSDKLRVFGKVTNIFDEAYGGLNATGTDADLPVNPQLGRSIRGGLTYNFN